MQIVSRCLSRATTVSTDVLARPASAELTKSTLTCKIKETKYFKLKLNLNSNENEIKNATGEDTYVGALRAPRAGSPAGVFAFVFVWIHVEFELYLYFFTI